MAQAPEHDDGQTDDIETEEPAETGKPSSASVATVQLESLAPRFDEEQHDVYLRRLDEAIADPRNRNIALTGRYGAGKSSVLDEFVARHPHATLRLAISSLAPLEADPAGESPTNQIQKEIVKQLLYGAPAKVGKNSRFRKIATLSKTRATVEAACFVAALGGLLYLFGWLPTLKGSGDSHPTWVRVIAWVGAAALATAVFTVIRLLTVGRFRVAEVAAGGAALTLDKNPDSYFDKFLDEIVYYFGREPKDIVIFEDLDRFEDPGIFEELRELNLLLNETPERRRRRHGHLLGRRLGPWLDEHSNTRRAKAYAKLPARFRTWLTGTGEPLRFVYALRDSVFDATMSKGSTTGENTAAGTDEGAGQQTKPGPAPAENHIDAAAAETERANRTKFFDALVTMVPFISHRTGRDLLQKLLDERGIRGIEPRLVNTIAHHCTDMRLMRNMCNEYLVFAELLLEPKPPRKPAPGMNPSHVFALVAYKNFHLEDFENITRRHSDLDRLYALHQKLVRDTIAARSEEKRTLLAQPEHAKTKAGVAAMLGDRLGTVAKVVHSASRYQGHQHSIRVGARTVEADELGDYDFWAEVVKSQSIDFMAAGNTVVRKLGPADLTGLFPEAFDAARWREYDHDRASARIADIETDIEALRSAGFEELVKMPRFTVVPDTTLSPGAEQPQPQSFEQLVQATLQSDLAQDLVRRGYLDRNFSLYAAQFYGTFTGLDVANFMVQHVQPNVPYTHFDLSRDGAVANLLDEAQNAGEELTETVAAFNIHIVNHLLATAHPGAGDVINNLVTGWGSDEVVEFLTAYFNDDKSERVLLATGLSEYRCPEVFAFLAGDPAVPADVRTSLFSAAATGYDPGADYDLGPDVRKFITERYRDMPAFTTEHPVEPAEHPAERLPERLQAMLERAQVVIPELRPLDDRLHQLVVDTNRYDMTADNLRSALGLAAGGSGRPPSVPLEVVSENKTVYENCISRLAAYLRAVGEDSATRHTVTTPQTLATVLTDVIETLEVADDEDVDPYDSDVAKLLALAAPEARLLDLQEAPQQTWAALAAANLFRGSLANMNAYRTRSGGTPAGVDAFLASLLEAAGVVHVEDDADVLDPGGEEHERQEAAVALLNTAHLTTGIRVELAASLEPPTPLPVTSITPTENDLFAQLLRRELVEDDLTTFERIREGGWAALGQAIEASRSIGTFLEPNIVDGMVADLFADPGCAAKLGRKVAVRADEFVPDDDWAALEAVANYAARQDIPLTPTTVARIARVADANGVRAPELILSLLVEALPIATADEVVEVFEFLGPDYNKVRKPGAKLKFDKDETHNRLLKVLASANRITRGYPKSEYSARVTSSA